MRVPHIFLIIQIFAIATIFSSNKSYGEIKIDDLCKNEWSYYTKILLNFDNNEKVLFIDRNGNVYNCLLNDYRKEILEKIEFIEKSIPIDRHTPLMRDASNWPPNVCSVSVANIFKIQYIAVHLPREKYIIDTDYCKIRVIRSAERNFK